MVYYITPRGYSHAYFYKIRVHSLLRYTYITVTMEEYTRIYKWKKLRRSLRSGKIRDIYITLR